MIRLLFIVPYPELEEKVNSVLAHHPQREELFVDVRVIQVEDRVNIDERDYDAIIARGYTARRTELSYRTLPTIDLPISGYDIVRAVLECCERYRPQKLAVCGFGGQMYEVKNICRHFGTAAEIYDQPDPEKLSLLMDQSQADGCDAWVGGYSLHMEARRRGLSSVVIRTGEEAVLQAVNEALHTVKRIRQERVAAQMYKTIIYSSKDGILYVDSSGVIRVRNYVVRAMNGNASMIDRPLKQVAPYLYKIFAQALESGAEEAGKILTIPGTRTRVSVSATPVVANGAISGVVLDLTDITVIQELEGQIRRKLNERGLRAKYNFADIIHESQVIDQVISKAQKYAASDSNVIIVGETGTGKELFAQSIHNSSSRKNGPFVAINCAALTENLLESELFGYVEGAFTGTSKGGKMGLFEQAHGGTLFLDEIGEISLSTQSKLLRTLQERQVRRIGDNKVIDVNVRIICATNKSIRSLAEQGKFRKDLVYRLDVLRLFIPPLRSRENDVELLFRHLLENQCRAEGLPVPELSRGALPLLREYSFEGNIRELKNIVERTSVLCGGGEIGAEELREALYPQDLDGTVSPRPSADFTAERAGEGERIRAALEQSGGNRTRAARLLGIDRTTLWRRMQKYGM